MTTLTPHLSHPKYRPDIDGLRAIAVLSVVAFHAFPAWLQGGFIGVDVFFVISGFLISTILFENLDKGTFRFSEFYARRVKRIFPALFLVLLACYTFGWFALLASEFKQLGKHTASGAVFISNFALWSEAGYFDNSAETKPLLHLWSLGIEEQFYILWPCILWLAWKHKCNPLVPTLLITFTSFALNINGVKQDATATFYWPHTRFWELLCGSLLAWLSIYKAHWKNGIAVTIKKALDSTDNKTAIQKDIALLQNIAAFVGCTLLIYGFFRISKDVHFPGKWAIVPVLSATLIIMAGPDAWINRKILSNKVAIWFGLISFPLYLWHWPLLSFARIVASDIPSINVRIVAIILSIMLAWLTYRFVETPMRNGKISRVKVIMPVVLVAGMGAIGYTTYLKDGLIFRDVEKSNSTLGGYAGGSGVELINECGISKKNIDTRKKFAVCASDKRAPVKYALIGDSKAAAIFDGLVRTSTQAGRWLFIGGNGKYGAPVPVLSQADIYKQHQELSQVAVKSIAANPHIKTVVIVTATRKLFDLSSDTSIEELPHSKNYPTALDGLQNTVDLLKNSGKKIVLVVDNPTLPHPEDCIYRKTAIPLVNTLIVKKNEKCTISIEKHIELSDKYRQLLKKIQSSHPKDVAIFDTLNYLCDRQNGLCSHTKDGRLLYSYTDHISDYAAGLIGKDLNRFISTY